ncbi:cell division protein ZipA [Halieaceae bacterium IMCC14734]|uniref:Cell division protein ZipA n=1 Tax=Candidatus Litorirhabdus singularis TaxID=2518993 RepID=A0ABT3THM1_9GAMM|nr:cell division protein ZipA [Candidatus Litorirhabdus singularis]MCX2981499.1 cell division protein ZipA [Candidatus Litorirhabdus singularis]
MDINVRDWMVIVGALLILAVLLDGYRRMRKSPSRVRMSLAKVPEEGADPDAPVMRELPNGGARILERAGGASDDDFADVSGRDSGDNLDLLQGMSARDPAEPEPPAAEEVILMHVVARDDDGFGGDDILQVLLACDLRFGEMNFFHRHEQAAGRGRIQFSVANMLQPGVFDIDAMSGFTTPGLTFFLPLPGPGNMMQAYEQMRETAESVAKHLGGDLLDDSRSVMTRQTLEHNRQLIRDLERRLLTKDGR